MSCTTAGAALYRFSIVLLGPPVTFKSTSQIVVIRTSSSLHQPEMWSLPRPWTPHTATRSVSLGPTGLASALSASGESAPVMPETAAMAAAILALS